MAQIKLTNEQSEEYFLNALCNGLGQLSGYGIEVDVHDEDYMTAKKQLKEKNPNNAICYEDIYMQVLKNGKKITFEDIEGDGEYTKSITLQDVHEKVQNTPFEHLTAMIEENDDAETADVILQTVLYDEIIFG
jgi:hypothetical protein